MSVIALRAGAARMLAAEEAGEHDRGSTGADDASDSDAAPTWAEIEAVARQALAELRQLLGVLRHDGEPPARIPPPGLGEVGRLIDEVRRAGLPVEADLAHAPAGLGPAADLCAYRVVQEALTNVMKHQGLVPTAVTVHDHAGHLEIGIASRPRHRGTGAAGDAAVPRGQGGASPRSLPRRGASGHGLAGMRERVALLGGELTAGPGPGGAFVVSARIPLAAVPA